MTNKNERKSDSDRDESESSDLDQKKNYKLPKHIPMCKCIIYDQSRHTGGAGRRKHGIQKRRPLSALRCDRKRQYQASRQYNKEETKCNVDTGVMFVVSGILVLFIGVILLNNKMTDTETEEIRQSELAG